MLNQFSYKKVDICATEWARIEKNQSKVLWISEFCQTLKLFLCFWEFNSELLNDWGDFFPTDKTDYNN